MSVPRSEMEKLDVARDSCVARLAFQVGLLAILVLFQGGCAVLGCRGCTRVNDPLPAYGQAQCTRATIGRLTPDQLPKQVFVGIAMSGGGSRAANFSAAALLELETLGVLPYVATISSVSGSSLVSAYYGRYGNVRPQWSEPELRRRMGENLQTQWELRWLWPNNVVRYWTTDFDRSDIMKDLFDSALFDGTRPTFANMNPMRCEVNPDGSARDPVVLPAIVINATTLSGQNFVFTDETFKNRLRSRLDTYPLSHAIMASAAFPGVFQNVTLEDYHHAKHYQHLFDGGPSDNLGVESLEAAIKALDQQTQKGAKQIAGCMFIVIDSFTNDAIRRDEKESRNSDTRKLLDFIVDDNFSNAVDAMLSHRREDTLEALGYPFERFEDEGENKNASIGRQAIWSYAPLRKFEKSPNRELICHVWHLTFQRLGHLPQSSQPLSVDVNEIKTQFRLGGFFGSNRDRYQDALYETARILVREDYAARDRVLAQFHSWGLMQ